MSFDLHLFVSYVVRSSINTSTLWFALSFWLLQDLGALWWLGGSDKDGMLMSNDFVTDVVS